MHFMHDLLKNLNDHAKRPLFKQYIGKTVDSVTTPSWTSISYETYLDDLHNAAGHWKRCLEKGGVNKGDVVGIWITGSNYTDLVHLYAVVRAGYVPQVFNLAMLTQGGSMINDLLKIRGGKSLIFDPHFSEEVHKVMVPTHEIPNATSIPKTPHESLGELPHVDDEDIALIFHTSGTTQGRPKPVPETHRWLRCQSRVNWPGAWQGGDGTQKTFNTLGSLANVGSATGNFITAINYLSTSGSCVIQTSTYNFNTDELLSMIHDEGLNNLIMYASKLSNILDSARSNSDVLNALRGMHQISYTGQSLNPEDLRWAVEQKIPLAVIYATTETAICLVSDLNSPETLPSMHFIEGMGCQLLPRPRSETSNDIGRDKQLFDLFVPGDADNCPHPSIRNRPDGHITGDLFEETRPGYYIFRGRNDDWIKCGRTDKFLGLCDTKSIEDNVNLTCSDLVQNCVVVGNSKPIVLFVEPTPQFAGSVDDPAGMKSEILKRIEGFQEKLFPHEKIYGPSRIVVAPPKSLPRTQEKGNIRRKAVEEIYADVLKDIYSQ